MASQRVLEGQRYSIRGVEYEVVAKRQKKQTTGYWVQGSTVKHMNQIVADVVPWPMIYKGQDMWEIQSGRDGLLCLCLVEELDESSNEFGIVSP